MNRGRNKKAGNERTKHETNVEINKVSCMC